MISILWLFVVLWEKSIRDKSDNTQAKSEVRVVSRPKHTSRRRHLKGT